MIHSSMNPFLEHSRQFILSFSQVFEACDFFHSFNMAKPATFFRNLSGTGPDPEYPNTGGIECRYYDVSGVSREGGEYERGGPPVI